MLTAGELLDLLEDALDDHPGYADTPIRVRGMVVTDVILDTDEIELIIELE